MRKMGWRGIAALGLLGVASFAAAQPPKSKAMPPGFWNDLFRPTVKQDEKKDEKPKPAIDKKADTAPPARDTRSVEQDRLMKAYLRRLAVCDRLRDIALEKDDAALAEEAAQLDALAWELYQEQSAKLLGGEERALEPEAPKPAAKQASTRGFKGSVPSRFRTGGLSEGTTSGASRVQEGDQ